MAHSRLSKLPPELLRIIFAQLPLSSLLAFAQTSKSNYLVATDILTYIELAILPKNVHSLLSFWEEDCRVDIDDDDSILPNDQPKPYFSEQRKTPRTQLKKPDLCPELYQIRCATQSSGMLPEHPSTILSANDPIVPKRTISPAAASPLSIRTAEFIVQNEIAATILSSRSIHRNVKSLKLHMYSLHTQKLATVLSSLTQLEHLNMNFCHLHIVDATLPANYWRLTPSQGNGSPIWNTLAGVGTKASSALKLRNLRSLTLRRAGITSFQLRSWIASNPNLQEVILEKVRGVDIEFVDWLADYICDQQERIDQHENLETVALLDCSELFCGNAEEFEWIDKLSQPDPNSRPQITTLSVRDCKNVDDGIFCTLAGPVEPSASGNSRSNSTPDLATESDDHQQAPSSQTSSELDTQPPARRQPWSETIYRLVSPSGTLIKEGRKIITHVEDQRMGGRSSTTPVEEGSSSNTIVAGPSVVSASHQDELAEDIIEVDFDAQ